MGHGRHLRRATTPRSPTRRARPTARRRPGSKNGLHDHQAADDPRRRRRQGHDPPGRERGAVARRHRAVPARRRRRGRPGQPPVRRLERRHRELRRHLGRDDHLAGHLRRGRHRVLQHVRAGSRTASSARCKRAADASELAARPHGWGVIMADSIQGASEAAVRRELSVVDSLVTGYQSGGILFDAARGTDGDASNLAALRDPRVRLGHGHARRRQRARRPHRADRHPLARGRARLGDELGDHRPTASRPTRAQSVGVLLTDAETGADPTNPVVRGVLARPATRSPATGSASSTPTSRTPRCASARRRRPRATGGAAPPAPAARAATASPGRTPRAPRASSSARRSRRRRRARRAGARPPTPPPTGSFVDPAEGADVAVGETVDPDRARRATTSA